MSVLTPSDDSQSASAWHVGISPSFPSHLIFSDDSAIESILTDIPYLAIGLLGFGVLTFFFAMRKFDRIAIYVVSSITVAFIAGVLDVGQVLMRGRAATDSDTHVSLVLPLLIAREVALSLSIAIRFFFFWSFVSLPPRGERPSGAAYQGKWVNFLMMEPDTHSGCWMRLGVTGIFLKYSLLLAVLLVLILQILWRVVGEFSRLGPVYYAESALEILASILFIVKLLGNVWLSHLRPRWKTIRDYSPVIAALLISSGIGLGNVLLFQFSETSLGRLIQTVELYVLVLYVLISSFYNRMNRVSMVDIIQDQERKSPLPFEDVRTGNQISVFEITPRSTFNAGSGTKRRPSVLDPRISNALSSQPVSDVSTTPSSPGPLSRPSTNEFLSWLRGRKPAQSGSRLKDDLEGGNSRVDLKASAFTVSGISAVESQDTVSQKESIKQLGPPSQLQLPERLVTNSAASTSSLMIKAEDYNKDLPLRPPKPPGSPVYGLDGIVKYYEQASPNRPDSVASMSLESLRNQQAELDRSLAELKSFASISTAGTVMADKQAVPGGPPDPLPRALPKAPLQPLSTRDVTKNIQADRQKNQTQRQNAEPAAEASATRRTPLLSRQSRRQLSFPSAGSSTGSIFDPSPGRSVVGTGGVEYDVTSFIGNLSTPAFQKASQNGGRRRPISRVIERPNSEIESPGPMKQQLEPAPPLVVLNPDPPVTPVAETEATFTVKPLPRRPVRLGIPAGTKFNISGPIRSASIVQPTAYEHPRPAPSTAG